VKPADAGFASLTVVMAMSVLLLVFGGIVAVADLMAASTRARTAADLAALAAAHAAPQGDALACARARDVAVDNHAVLLACRLVPAGDPLADSDVVVSAGVAGPMRAVAGWLGLEPPVLRARALAGPARQPPSP
jgi:secretion/DNA translocation related TadE-like protein